MTDAICRDAFPPPELLRVSAEPAALHDRSLHVLSTRLWGWTVTVAPAIIFNCELRFSQLYNRIFGKSFFFWENENFHSLWGIFWTVWCFNRWNCGVCQADDKGTYFVPEPLRCVLILTTQWSLNCMWGKDIIGYIFSKQGSKTTWKYHCLLT